jgi:Predicted hydrolase of the metallo-beta-lactamase superfamily
VILAEDGSVIDLKGGVAELVGQVECGYVYVDGSKVGTITDEDLKDRVTLGEEGFISVITVINRQNGTLISGPDIHARGVAEDDAVFNEIKPKIAAAILEAVANNPNHSTHQLQQIVRRVIGSWVSRKLRRRPMIVPVVLEA